jgi:hypothetical protein
MICSTLMINDCTGAVTVHHWVSYYSVPSLAIELYKQE